MDKNNYTIISIIAIIAIVGITAILVGTNKVALVDSSEPISSTSTDLSNLGGQAFKTKEAVNTKEINIGNLIQLGILEEIEDDKSDCPKYKVLEPFSVKNDVNNEGLTIYNKNSPILAGYTSIVCSCIDNGASGGTCDTVSSGGGPHHAVIVHCEQNDCTGACSFKVTVNNI